MKEGKPRHAASRSEGAHLAEILEVLERVARAMVRQLGGRYTLDDLKGFAHEAAADLAARYDAKRAGSFRSYARLRLRGAIIDGLRKESGLPRGMWSRLRAIDAGDEYVGEKAEENAQLGRDLTPAEVADAKLAVMLRAFATAYAAGIAVRGEEGAMSTPHDDAEDPELAAGRSHTRKVLEETIATIGDPEATILRRHYFHDEDLQDAAAHVGLSKSWGSRLHARGIEKLAEKLKERKDEF
jgi:RNA polymerase sigma factor FliA